MTKLEEYAKRLGVETSSTLGDTITDINAGKAGYEKYLADVESYKKAQEQAIAESEANKSWWGKVSDFILQANQMSNNMSDNPAVSGFKAAVEAYKNMPEDNKPSDDWTDEERWIFGEKYASDSKSAYDYAKRLNAAKAQQKKEQQAKAIERWTNRNLGNQVLGSAASLGLNATMGGLGFLDAMAQMAGRGEIQQHDILLPHEIAGTMQGAVASDLNKYGTLNEKIPIIGGKGWGDVYGLGMSIAQSKLAVTAGGGVGSLVQFFGMSASQGVSDALERGATGEQALAFGTVSGLAEAIPEMISLDKFIGIASSEAVESVFKNVLKMAGEEAGEELTTSLITEVADRWIMGGKSEFQLRVNELVASGMSLEEAKKAAWKQTINNIAFDTLSGAISGGVSGAIGTGVNRVNQRLFQTEANETAKKALTPEQDNLIAEAKKYDTTKKRASALEKKLAEGKELTGYDLRMLANQVSEASRTADVETTRKAIVQQMKDGGLSDGEAKKLGEIALNKAIGNEVSKVQDLMLKRSEVGTKVYNQISADVMRSGVGDSEWAKSTPIERLRAEKEAIKQNSEIKTENKPKTGLEQLKEDVAAKYGVKATDYKINTESLEGKIEKIDGGYAYKKSSADSKIHTEGITSPLTEQDIVELSAIEKIANELGIDIHVYETKVDNKTGERSYTDKDGKKYSDSGFYNPGDNSIHIDLRAGENGEGTMLYTASHEVVHFIKENASEQYEALEKLVTKELIQGGFSIDKLIDKQKDILRKNGWDGTESDFEAVAREEMVAEACQSFLASKNAVAEIRALKSENRGLWNALKKFFTSLFAKINKIYKELPPDAPEGKYIAEMRNAVKPIRDAFMEGAVAASKNAKSTTKQTISTEIKSKARAKITAEMTDAERYNELKDKKITAPYYNGEVDALIAEELEGKINNEAKKAVVKIAEKLGILKSEINVKDLDVNIKISRSSLKESVEKDATPEQIAKLLPIITPTAEEAILIERHDNRYYFDTDTVYFDNLFSGYIDNSYFIPIRFGLKHSGSGKTTLYVVVDQNKVSVSKIKNSTGHQAAAPDLTGASKSSLRAIYSIAEIIPFVKSKDLLRYLPDQMLSTEQKTAKWEAIAETIRKTNEKNDKKYADYISKGDERSARQMVKAAAKSKGYTDVVYHGTKNFGFTEFDPEKSDDKLSIFAAGATELAQTYSGKQGTKKVSDNKNIDSLSNDEVVKMLNEEASDSYEGEELQTEYEIMNLSDVNKLINEVNAGIEDLQKVVDSKIKEYADRMASDFNDADAKTHSRLVEAKNLLDAYEYKRLSTPLYVLMHYTDAFESNPEVADLEYKIRLMNKLTDADTSNGVVVKKDLGGYGVSILTFDKAREELKALVSSGNYALYGKPGRQLVIDAKGQNWNNIKNWIQSAYRSTNDTYVKKDDSYYRLYDSNTDEQLFHGRIEITEYNKDISIDTIHPIMVQKANNVLAIRSEYMRTTRDIAKFAKDEGYDSVKFENLEDNGGTGESVGASDVYVYFNPSDLKSADTITYDDNGNVIPLSERFNEQSKDIRHSYRGKYAKADNSQLNRAIQMEQNGQSSEEIRKATGWFKSYDGKWRIEIDDSPMVIKPQNYAKGQYLMLPDVIEHEELFEAYPQLKDVWFAVDPTIGEGGRTTGSGIVLRKYPNNSSRLDRGMLLHEIQHVIQYIEGFATGASPSMYDYDAWDDKLEDALNRRNAAANKLYAILRRRGNNIDKSEIENEQVYNLRDRDKIVDRYYFELSGLAESNKRTKEIWDEYWKATQELIRSTPYGKYQATAGEIEAYDVMARADLTAEERKNNRPNIDRTDAIIVGNSEISYFARTTEEDSAKKQLRDHLSEVNSLEPVADVTYKVTTKSKAKEDAKLLYKRIGEKIDRQNFGIIELSEKELGESSNYLNTAAEFAAWMTIPRVLKRGKLISGHEDHKGGGFPTYTIAAPVIINGKRGNVVVVVKKTGKYRYKVHRILMPDGSQFIYEEIKNNAEPTGSDVTSKNASKRPDISSASDNSILQSAEDVNTKSEIRHKSRSYTSGQMAQVKANLSHNKVYSKKSAMELVSKIAPNIRNRSFEALSDQLWQGLNTYTSLDDKRQFAKDMAEMFVDRMMVDTLVKHSEWDKAVERMAYIKPAISSINLRDEDISELKYILDKDYPRLRGRWGYKTPSNGEFKRPYGLDEFITDLSREMPGMEHLAEMHPAEALIEVDKLYTELSEQVKEKYESAYNDVPDAFIDEMRQSIEYEIMSAYTELGERTKISKYLFEKFEYYESRVQYWKGENAKTHTISRWNGILSTKAMHIRELKKGAFYNATQYHEPDLFKNSIEQLANIQWRGNISPKSIRKVFANLKQWYTKDNPMLYREGADNNLYSDTIAKYIDMISDTEKGAFDANTYAMVYDVMNHLYIMMRNYNKIFRAGRWEDAPDLAKAYLKVMEDNKRNRSAIGRVKDTYINEFLEPMAVAKRADNYNADGFYTQTVKEMREASIAASIGEMRLRKKYDTFIDENKKYLTNAAKETVNYRGFDIPKIHLIGLYMTMKREHARAGLAINGFEYSIKNKWWDSESKVYVPGFLPDADNQDMINAATEEQMKIIEKSFTDVDKQYIEILETLFNEDLRNLKVERDMERQGYTNATLDYYYPIMRGAMAENVDTTKISDQNRATNSSFNKNTVKGAKQRLVIISADAMVNKHITDMCKYYYMSQAFENYNVLYNCDVSGNPNNPVNIAAFAEEAKIWEKDKDYFRKLVADMQGIREPQSQIERALEKFRGNYAKFALGLNAKVLATQFSSIIAAGNVLGFKSLVSLDNFKVSSADIDKYCPIATVRSYEKVALKAMSVTDKLDKTTELFTSAISVVDSFVIKRLFASCQIEAEKRGEGNLGTEQNKIAAGKILEQVIIETQQNSYATERSQAMRSRSEILKSLTMFTADSMKLISRVHEAAGELRVAMASKDTARIKKARKQLAKSLAVLITSSVYLAAIAVLFNWILAKDDEEKEPGEKVLAFALDALGNSISALPGISDLYEMIVNGFEVESAAFDTINNVLKGVSNITKDAHNLITGNGETSIEDVNRDLRTLLYGIGQMTGIPVRNFYNLSRGILDKFSPKATYYLDSKFYETSLKTDFEKAVEEGNMPKTTYILSLLYDDRIQSDVSMAQRKEIIRLTNKEYNVLPKSIPDEIKRNGETYVLTDTQKDAIAKEYSKVVPALDKLMSSSFYSARSDKDKAYLIDYYHDKYYDIAVDKVLGIKDNKVAIYNTVGFSTYAKLAYLTKGVESDKDKDGNTISGSKKANVLEIVNKTSIPEGKKLLYIASLGYSLSAEDKQKLCKYLNSLSIGDSTKRKLAEVCGLTYKKGKITP